MAPRCRQRNEGHLHRGPSTENKAAGLERDENHLGTGSGYGRSDPQKLGHGI